MEKQKSIGARSFAIIRQHFASLWLVAAWPHICMAVLFLCVGAYLRGHRSPGDMSPMDLWSSMDGLQRSGMIGLFILMVSLPQGLAVGGVSAFVWTYLHTGTVSLRDAFAVVSGNFARLLVLSVCVGTVTILGSMLVIPGFVAAIFTAMAIPIMLIEHVGIFAATRRGAKLAVSNLGTVAFSVFAAAAIGIVLVVSMFVTLFMWVMPNAPEWAVGIAVWTVLVVAVSLSQMVKATLLTNIYADASRPNA